MDGECLTRAPKGSETFDLAGKAAASIESIVRDAFAIPFESPARITLVTGAGKLGRQKYDEHAARVVTTTLRELDYEDNSSGSPGTFKMQHDTGKNLKTVVIHPLVDEPSSFAESRGHGNPESEAEAPSLLEEGTPQYLMVYADIKGFRTMINQRCTSWSQKKGALGSLDEVGTLIESLDKKLQLCGRLSQAEQSFYDGVSANSIDDKREHLRSELTKHVDDGRLTAREKKSLTLQVSERIRKLTKDLDQARETKQTKVESRLSANLQKAEDRKAKLGNISPVQPHDLRHERDIAKLREELAPLLQFDNTKQGGLLSLKETKMLVRKGEIESEIETLEEASREWFEPDEVFLERVSLSRSRKVRQSSKPSKQVSSGSKIIPSWVTPAASSKSAWKKPSTAGKKTKATAGSVFSAMTLDSDSD